MATLLQNWRLKALFVIGMAGLVALSNELVQYPVNFYGLGHYWTWAAFAYPFTFLLCDLCTRSQGAGVARSVIAVGFAVGVALSLLIDLRIAMASGTAFLCAQLMDVEIFRRLARRGVAWWVPPFVSSAIVSVLDTILFFGLAFYGTGVDWVSLAMGDYVAKILVVLFSLLPYRLLLPHLKAYAG